MKDSPLLNDVFQPRDAPIRGTTSPHLFYTPTQAIYYEAAPAP